jgi:hypothetical protein
MISKSQGHCYNGTGCNTCRFWKYTDKSKCTLFNIIKNESESLVICNKVYGLDYSGKV